MPLIRLRGSVRLIVIRPTFVACNHANCGRLAVTHACIYMYLVPTDGIQSIFLNLQGIGGGAGVENGAESLGGRGGGHGGGGGGDSTQRVGREGVGAEVDCHGGGGGAGLQGSYSCRLHCRFLPGKAAGSWIGILDHWTETACVDAMWGQDDRLFVVATHPWAIINCTWADGINSPFRTETGTERPFLTHPFVGRRSTS